MPAEIYVDLGETTIVHCTRKAALCRLTAYADGEEHWVPFSTMAVNTLANCTPSVTLRVFRVSEWLVDKLD